MPEHGCTLDQSLRGPSGIAQASLVVATCTGSQLNGRATRTASHSLDGQKETFRTLENKGAFGCIGSIVVKQTCHL